MLEVLFWACAAFVVYAYVGYPAFLYVLARLRPRPVHQSDVLPFVSLIITARNEEARMREKLLNTVALTYPRDRLEIVVASDCSTDGTHAIVEEFAAYGVRLVIAPERRGKEFAQKLAIDDTTGEVLVFSDVATRLDPNGLQVIVRSFADPAVGAVTGADGLLDADGRAGGSEGAYVRYEMFIRALESEVGSVVGLSGSFFAARRAVCRDWLTDLPSDFTTMLNTLRSGMRGISDPNAVGYYKDVGDRRLEYHRKVRTVVRGMAALLRHVELMNPFRFGLSAWQLFSHKLCRWLVPFAFVGLLVTNVWLLTHSTLYTVLGVGQLLAWIVAGFGLRRRGALSGLPHLLTFLAFANLSILDAWYQLLRGRRVVVWEPSRR